MNEKESVQTILVRRKDVEDLLEQFNEHAYSSWSIWLGKRIRELPILTVKGELTLQGDSENTYRKKDDLNKIMAETLRSINRSLDQLTANFRAQMESIRTTKEPKTNADWLRSMTDAELIQVLADSWPCNFYDGCCPVAIEGDSCFYCVEHWLNAPKGTNPDAYKDLLDSVKAPDERKTE